MRLSRNLAPHIISSTETVGAALKKINSNRSRQVLVVSPDGRLEGILTDGDFRRWIVSVADISLDAPVSEVMNKNYVHAAVGDKATYIESLFSQKINSVPVIDGQKHLVAIAWQNGGNIRLGNREIGEQQPSFLIAEIGNNHNGSLALAKRLVELAAEAGADCAKFQMRDLTSLYGDEAESQITDLGAEYTEDLLRRFQLTPDEMFEVLNYTADCGLVPLCTPWDEVSLQKLNTFGACGYKIASADLTNHALLSSAADTLKPLILSTGMSLEHEIKDAVSLLTSKGAEFALLHCNSAYPAPMHDVNLSYLARLRRISAGIVGYSGHERGYEVCIAAVAMGAKIIEKHFTVDRAMEGNDHRVSLLPEEFSQMVTAIRNIEDALGADEARRMSQGERLNRETLAKSLVASRAMKPGQTLSRSDIDIKSPGQGIQPSHLPDLIGKTLTRSVKKGEPFFLTDIAGSGPIPRPYSFDRPWGIPVRYHDMESLTALAPMDIVEIHFSYRDLDLKIDEWIQKPIGLGLVVHSPELFSGDHIMNLASTDDDYRKRSIRKLQTVVDRTQELKSYFTNAGKPLIIINAGGFSEDDFVAGEMKQGMYERVAESLEEIDEAGVEIIIQTMPPFPWHFGGQRYHNLFVHAQEIKEYCEKYRRRICYDVSHSKLACNLFKESLQLFTETVGPFVAHLHIVDARGVRDEGLQIGDGEIDFVALGRDLSKACPDASFVPEVWQGHKNSGRGFWLALERLEGAFSIRHKLSA